MPVRQTRIHELGWSFNLGTEVPGCNKTERPFGTSSIRFAVREAIMLDASVPIADRIFRGSWLQLLVISRSAAASFVPDKNCVIVSVTDPGRDNVVYSACESVKGILRVQFHDIGQLPDMPGIDPRIFMPDDCVPFSGVEASAILDFITNNLADIEMVVCQCEAGISRSAAIAAALSRIYNGDDSYFFENYMPNIDVYNSMIDVSRRGV